MKHLIRPHMQVYRNRDYVAHLLTPQMFSALNSGSAACQVTLATTGCLDAIDSMPAGSMEDLCDGRYFDQSLINRNYTLAERERMAAHAKRIIDEIRAEESHAPNS